MPGPINVVCATDDAYAMPLAAALRSALHFLGDGWRLRVFVLDAGVRQETAQRLKASLDDPRMSLELIDIRGARVARYPSVFHINWVSLSKLLISELVPVDVDKVIWLDCDLIVCADLSSLWLTDLAGRPALAKRESVFSKVLTFAPELGIDPGAPYFNSGVLVLDVDLLRREAFTARAIQCLEDNLHRRSCQDQDVLNIVWHGRWGELDPRWNHIPSSEPASLDAIARARAQPHPFIVHYAGHQKPWRHGYAYAWAYANYFYLALDETQWRGWRPPVDWREVARARWPAAFRLISPSWSEGRYPAWLVENVRSSWPSVYDRLRRLRRGLREVRARIVHG